jgi:hypothetical protein
MDYLSKFNDTFQEFSQDILRVFPGDDEFRMYNAAISAALMLNPDIILDVFHRRVIVPFGDRIIAKDESFFLNHSYEDVKGNHEDADAIIEKVKSYWEKLSEENRETVWKYFRVLVHLGRKIRT